MKPNEKNLKFSEFLDKSGIKGTFFNIKLDESWIKPKKPFYILFSNVNRFKKNDVLELTSDEIFKVKVLKVYNIKWWKKILMKFGMKFRINQLKVIEI